MEGIFSAWGRILTGHTPALSIEITRECPLRCPGCYAYGDDHLGGSLTLREVRDFKGQELVDGVIALVDRHRPLHVSIGMKMADVRVNVTGLSTGGQVSVLVFPEDLGRLGAGLERVMTGGSQLDIGGLPPGRYRLLATDAPNLWTLQQRPDLLKAIESSTQGIDVPEGGRVSATVEAVSREELLRAVAEKEQ